MGKYIQFSEDDIKRARETDIASLLRSEGQALKKAGSEMVWGDGSEKVTVRGNLWYHQYDAEGGDAIRFVERFYHRSFPEAVEFLLGNQFGALQIPSPVPKTTKAFRPPEKNENMRRVYAYLLNQRGIEKEVLDQFVRCGLIYEDAVYHNCVFVGMDENGTVKHCHKRSIGSRSTFKVNAPGSDPAYSFHWLGGSENLFLFEAPIDMLSFISMHGEEWKQENYAACCGVSDRVLFHILDKHSEIQNVFLCLDNDEAGQHASRRITEKLNQKQIQSEILVPVRKDWNEDLLVYGGEMEQSCPELQC